MKTKPVNEMKQEIRLNIILWIAIG